MTTDPPQVPRSAGGGSTPDGPAARPPSRETVPPDQDQDVDAEELVTEPGDAEEIG